MNDPSKQYKLILQIILNLFWHYDIINRDSNILCQKRILEEEC